MGDVSRALKICWEKFVYHLGLPKTHGWKSGALCCLCARKDPWLYEYYQDVWGKCISRGNQNKPISDVSINYREIHQKIITGDFFTYRQKGLSVSLADCIPPITQTSLLPVYLNGKRGLLYVNFRWAHEGQQPKNWCPFPYIPKTYARLIKGVPPKLCGDPSSNTHRPIMKIKVKEHWEEKYFCRKNLRML